MLYHLLFRLHDTYSVLNVARYITFRTAVASITALFISLVFGPWMIRRLREFQIGQVIRQEGPESHRAKAGTPTMGGLLILTAALVPTLLWADLTNPYVWVAVLATAAFGGIGFADDYLKVTRRSHHGLRPLYKLGLQVLVATAVGVALLVLADHNLYNTRLIFPFFKRVIPELGWLYVPFAVLVLVGASNAVNLTDGLDGLAISTFTVAAATFTALAYVTGHRVFAEYLLIVRFAPAAELTVFCGALVGAGLGFLWYNSYPAEIFMGDVGSLALGGAIGTVAILDQAGDPARHRRRRLRGRGAVGDPAGGVVQAHGAAHLQDGAAAPSLRTDRLERAEGDHAVPDRGDPLRAVQPHHVEAAMTATTEPARSGADARRAPGATVAPYDLDGRRVLVVGAARSGLAAAAWLAGRGARVTLTDASDAADVSSLDGLGVATELGPHRPECFHAAELIVLSPGVSPWLPIVQAARHAGVPVVGELELASRFLKGRVIAITGTKGKSTTTTLIGRMCEAAGMPVRVGGNLGPPLSGQVDGSTQDTVHVVEVSSFQLETTATFRPWIAVWLNFSADHQDRHASLTEYRDAKARIFANQRDEDVAVVNADDATVMRAAATGAARVLPFSLRRVPEPGFGIVGGQIVHRRADGLDEALLPTSAIRLIGPHLVSDVVAATAASWLAGAAPAALRRAVEQFHGLEHALEPVGEIAGVRFVNDSKATNIEAATRAVESFAGGVVPILGGRFKGGDWRDLRQAIAARAQAVVAIGEAAPQVRAALEDLVPVHEATGMDAAVEAAFAAASRGGVVVLAPACASFDMFRDYAERGRAFKAAVARLAATVPAPRER